MKLDPLYTVILNERKPKLSASKCRPKVSGIEQYVENKSCLVKPNEGVELGVVKVNQNDGDDTELNAVKDDTIRTRLSQ